MLRKILCFLFLGSSLVLDAQNGETAFPFPATYTYFQTQIRNALTLDNAGNKWVGFQGIGVGKFDGANWTFYSTANSGLPYNTVNAIAFDNANKAWIGTSGGAARFDGSTWTVFNTTNSGLPGDSVLAIVVQGSKTWFATNRGIGVYNGSVWTVFNRSNSGLLGDTVVALAAEPSGTIWAGSTKGLSGYNGFSWTNYTYATSSFSTFLNTIKCLYVDGASHLWIGLKSSYYGAFRLAGTTFTPISSLLSPGTQFPTSYCVNSFCTGPHGGVSFSISNHLYELEFLPTKSII
jgi:ligand-binding sensor domain-containing protein